MSSSDPRTLPEAAAAERLRQHLEEIARERDRAHRALQEREAELVRIQRIGRVGGVEVDLREGFTNRRSPEYLLIHGLPPDAAGESHEDWVNRIHPEDRERVLGETRTAMKAGSGVDFEYRVLRADGSTMWVRDRSCFIKAPDGSMLCWQGVIIDVTDRHQIAATNGGQRYLLLDIAANHARRERPQRHERTQRRRCLPEQPAGARVRSRPSRGRLLPRRRTGLTGSGPAGAVVGADLDDEVDERRSEIWHAGVEYRYVNLLAGRFGYVYDDDGDFSDPTYGLGFIYKDKLSLDYANVPQAETLERVHRWSLYFSF